MLIDDNFMVLGSINLNFDDSLFKMKFIELINLQFLKNIWNLNKDEWVIFRVLKELFFNFVDKYIDWSSSRGEKISK